MTPLVTIITATYNSSALLKLSLSSLVAQEHRHFEAWIVGDACSDDSAEVVASFGDSRLQWLNLPLNSGSQAGPNNEGLSRAQGDLIAFLGHDDLWFPWHLEALVATQRASDADFVHGLGAVIDRRGPCGATVPPPPGVEYRDHFVPPSTWLIRRNAAMRWGRWADPATLPWPVDYDYLRRAALSGASFAFSPRLGVLKFPSAYFRSYASAEPPPQRAYLAAMRDDPGQLERRVLSDLAVALGQHPLQLPYGIADERRLLLRAFRTALRSRVVNRWRESRLMSGLMRLHFQRQRRRFRRVRGLTS